MIDGTAFRDPSRAGTALITVAVVVLLLGVLASGTVNLMVAGMEGQAARRERVVQVIAAEDAVNRAVRQLEADLVPVMDLAVGEELAIFAGRDVNGCVTGADCRTLSDDEILVTATAVGAGPAGPSGGYRVELRTRVASGPSPAFGFGLFSNESLDLNNFGTYSYDSTDPGYAGLDGDIGSNGDIVLGSASSTIRGSLTAGPPPAVYDVLKPGDVLGPMSNASQALVLPEPIWTVPAANDNAQLDGAYLVGDALLLAKGATVEMPAGVYVFSTLSIALKATLRLTGDAEIYVTSSLGFGGNRSSIDLGGAHALTIFLDGDLDIPSNSGGVVGVARPADFNLVVKGAHTLAIDSNNAFTGVIYAPSAVVDYHSNNDIYGLVVGDDLNISSNIDLHYDVSLAGYDPDWLAAPAGLEVTGWRGTAGRFP